MNHLRLKLFYEGKNALLLRCFHPLKTAALYYLSVYFTCAVVEANRFAISVVFIGICAATTNQLDKLVFGVDRHQIICICRCISALVGVLRVPCFCVCAGNTIHELRTIVVYVPNKVLMKMTAQVADEMQSVIDFRSHKFRDDGRRVLYRLI